MIKMDVNAHDVQLCLLKILKLSSKTCVAFSLQHPIVSFSLLCLFILYMFFPTIFWVLIYSFPLVVSILTILGIYYSLRNGKKCKESEKEDGTSSKKIGCSKDNVAVDKRSCMRVHSVRRRRAKDIIRREEEKDNKTQYNVEEKGVVSSTKDIRREEEKDNNTQYNVEEKNAVFSTKFNLEDQMVDKSALIEEIPKEIREVEVDSSQVSTTKCSSDEEEEEGGEDENNAAVQWTEDDQKNVMEIGISDTERNKRLESLIARRRARKLLSLQVRRTLMNMDRNDPPAQMASLIIPRHNNNSYLPNSSSSGQFSPGPGSAPSILVPMRNPFDLPYDPQEEKPDLTGDSFQQEFTSSQNKDMMFCRHESFRSGAFLPGDFDRDREQTSFFHGFGLRQRDYSSQGYQTSKIGDLFDRELTRIIERGSAQVPAPKPINDAEDDQIKEVIQVYENGTDIHDGEDIGEVQTKPTLDEDSSTTSSSSSSTEEDGEPLFKIDKEAILRSLCSPARRNIPQSRYGASPFQKTSLEEHIYYANKSMPRHRPSYSIASDMQVEISDVSSPPTIDENLSCKDEDISTYDGSLEKKTGFGSEESWASSSHLFGVDENESRSVEVNEVSERDVIKSGFSRINKTMKDPVPLLPSNPELRPDNGQADSLQAISPVENLAFPENEDVQQSTRNIVTYPSPENDSGNQTSELETTGNIETNQHTEDEESSTTWATLGSDDPQVLSLNVQQIPIFQSSLISPKSVLHPTFSVDNDLSSLDQHIDHEVQQHDARTFEVLSPVSTQIPTPLIEESTAGDNETIQHESFESSNTSAMGADNTLSSDVAPEVQSKQMEETSSRSFNNDEAGAETTAFSKHIDIASNSNSSLSTDEESSKDQEKVNRDVVTHSDSYEDQKENSALQEDIGHEHDSINRSDLKGYTNSTSSNCSEVTRDETQNSEADQNPIGLSAPVEHKENSDFDDNTTTSREQEQHAISHALMADSEEKIEDIITSHGETK